MNPRNLAKLTEISDAAGFLPDGDLLEMGGRVLKMCLEVLREKGLTQAAEVLVDHFDRSC